MMPETEVISKEKCILKGKAEQAKGNCKLTANLRARRLPCQARLSRHSVA